MHYHTRNYGISVGTISIEQNKRNYFNFIQHRGRGGRSRGEVRGAGAAEGERRKESWELRRNWAPGGRRELDGPWRRESLPLVRRRGCGAGRGRGGGSGGTGGEGRGCMRCSPTTNRGRGRPEQRGQRQTGGVGVPRSRAAGSALDGPKRQLDPRRPSLVDGGEQRRRAISFSFGRRRLSGRWAVGGGGLRG